jgi:MFS superfamily sulfate permease-like transporter
MHLPTLILGLSLLAVLFSIRRVIPRLSSALLLTVLGIVLVITLDLDHQGVGVLGSEPAGMPSQP